MPDSMEVIIQGEQGQSPTVMNVAEGQEVIIVAGLKNPGNQERHNIRVEFLVDGQPADVSFIPVLAPGQLVTVQTTYEVPDAYSHTVEVKATEGEGAEAVTLASISGYLANEEGEQTQLPTEPPEEGYWIGAFNLKPTHVTNPDLNHYTGNGTIEIPFMSEYPVEFSDLQINEAEKRVTGGQIRLELGVLDIVIEPVTVHLTAIVFEPTEARCEGSAGIQLVFSPDPLALDIADLLVLPNGLSGKLSPSNEVVFQLIDPTDFVLTISPSSFVRLHDNAILISSFDGKLSSPDSILQPAGGSGEIQFSGLILDPAGGIYGNAVLAQSSILGTNISLGGGVVLDLSNTTSPEARENGWKGVYVTDGSISLPGAFSSISIQEISGLFIDGTGVTGLVEKDNLGDQFDLQGGFFVQFTSLTVGFEGMSCTGGSLMGEVQIPIVKTGVGFDLPITQQGNIENSVLTIDENKEIDVPGFFIKLGLQGGSVSIDPQKITAELKVTLTTELGGSVVGINVPSAFFLVIDSYPSIGVKPAGQTDIGAWITLDDQNVSFDGAFNLSLEGIGFGIKGSKFYFGVKGGISIANLANADATILTLADLNMDYSGIEVSDIHLSISQPRAFNFVGDVAWYDEGPMGHGFKGDMNLNVIDTFDASATLRVGSKNGTNYWYIAGAMSVGGTGIPLTPVPISIYGFTGGAYYNMTAERNEVTNEVSYTVHDEGFGLMAGMVVGTSFDDGFTWHGDVGLEVTIGDGTTITLGGDSYILCDRTEEPANRKVTTDIQISPHPFVFSGRLEADRIDLVDAVSLVRIQDAEIDLKLAADDWHFYVGRKTRPIQVKVLPTFVDLGASGYFDIDQLGMRAGARVELDSGKKWLLIFYGRVWGGFQGDFEVGFRPAFVYAEFSVWMGLEAGIGIQGLGSFQVFEADALLNAGVRTPNPTRLWAKGRLHYSILCGLISGTWSMSFTWGDPYPETAQVSEYPVIESIYPENLLENVSVMSNIQIMFTSPVGERIKYPDETGREYEVRVLLDSVSLSSYDPDTYSGIEIELNENNYHWNVSRTVLSIEMDDFFLPNQNYLITVKGHAVGSLLEQIGGRYDDTRRSAFVTGPFPDDVRAVISKSHPFNGQEYWYRSYPIEIEFKRAMDYMAEAGVVGRLFREDETEFPGQYSMESGHKKIIFQPAGPLEPSTNYIFKLTTQQAGSESSGTSGPGHTGMTVAPDISGGNNQGTNQTSGGGVNVSTEVSSQGVGVQGISQAPVATFANLATSLGEDWLEIKFKTSNYNSFYEMMSASSLNMQVTRYTYNFIGIGSSDEQLFLNKIFDEETPWLSLQFQTVEPIYWADIKRQAEMYQPSHWYPGGSPQSCVHTYNDPESSEAAQFGLSLDYNITTRLSSNQDTGQSSLTTLPIYRYDYYVTFGHWRVKDLYWAHDWQGNPVSEEDKNEFKWYLNRKIWEREEQITSWDDCKLLWINNVLNSVMDGTYIKLSDIYAPESEPDFFVHFEIPQ